MAVTLDAALLTGWTDAAIAALRRHVAEVDRINVFPVADGDTGTNLLLTLQSAAEAAAAVPGGGGCRAVAKALARGALVGARGNSGVALSQVLRGLADALQDAGTDPGGPGPARVLAAALRRGTDLAAAAFSDPREGTVLTVLAAAADAASRVASGRAPAPAGIAAGAAHAGLAAVAVATADAAAAAVAATTAQLPELGRAGVVDAGGLGLWVVLDALAALLAGRPAADALPTRGPVPARPRAALTAERETGSADLDYEVMYLLEAASVGGLRTALAELGDSVAVVGDGQGLWNVHVHCNDAGAAIEAGLAVGRPRRITVVRFADAAGSDPERFPRSRAVLMVVPEGEVAALARAAGAAVLERDAEPVSTAELVAALAGTQARHVVLLPDDGELTPVAETAAAAARREGQDVLVLPTASVLQGLAALAVHDPARRAGEDVVAMAEAAAGTRTAALMVAESEALTWVGRCEPGDVLGLADGEVVLIAPDLSVGALWLAHRMLLGGGEIVTVLLGAAADPALGERLVADLRRTHPEVDVVVHRGGQADYPLVLGVE